MECGEVRLRLVRYLDNDLSAFDRKAVEAHLEHCYLCHEEVTDIATVLDVCRNALRHPHPENRFDLLHAEIHRTVPPIPQRLRLLRPLVSALAAAALILVLVNVGKPVVHTAQRVVAVVDWVRTQEAQTVVAEPSPDAPRTALVWQQRILWARGLSENAAAPVESSVPRDPEGGTGAELRPVSCKGPLPPRWALARLGDSVSSTWG
jgi:anti-sigma factor RsiW